MMSTCLRMLRSAKGKKMNKNIRKKFTIWQQSMPKLENWKKFRDTKCHRKIRNLPNMMRVQWKNWDLITSRRSGRKTSLVMLL